MFVFPVSDCGSGNGRIRHFQPEGAGGGRGGGCVPGGGALIFLLAFLGFGMTAGATHHVTTGPRGEAGAPPRHRGGSGGGGAYPSPGFLLL